MHFKYNKFNNIEVTLGIGCSLNCRFCPQALLINKYGNNSAKKMSFSTFIHCTKNVVQGGGIVFSGMSEPFLNEECASMIKHAYEEGFKVTLYTTLIGMKEKDFEQIKDINFDSLILHIPDKENNSKFILNDKYWQMFEKFVSVMNISEYHFHGTPHEKVFGIIPSNAAVAGESFLFDRAGNLNEKGLLNVNLEGQGKLYCKIGRPDKSGSWAPEILPDGRVTLCCMDYGMKHILGNILYQTAEEIMNGEEYQKVLKGMADESTDVLCRKCIGAYPEKDMPYYRMNLMLKEENAILPEDHEKVINKFKSAKNICILGLGKLFRDEYFPLGWDKAIRANLFCDNKIEKLDWLDVNIIKPEQLIKYEDLLVITYVTEPKSLEVQLEKLGIHNYINICYIYDSFEIFRLKK